MSHDYKINKFTILERRAAPTREWRIRVRRMTAANGSGWPERAEVLATDSGVWAVLRRGLACPYCGDIHVHGRSEGHRVAHCHERPITLFLGAADDREFTLSNADGYWLLEPNGKES